MRGFEFAELKAFAAVVERKSFARAAEHLGLSPSALSQTIRQLEGRIGTRLLNRTTRSVAPSASGELLYGRIAPLFREMDAAVAEATEAAGHTTGTLRINTLGIAARTIIAPRLSRFHQAYPEVLLDIVVDDALADIVVGRFDAGIRVGGRLEKDMIAVRLSPDLNMVAVAKNWKSRWMVRLSPIMLTLALLLRSTGSALRITSNEMVWPSTWPTAG